MTRGVRGEQGAKKKTRKPRGWKQGDRGQSYDWCPYCFRPGCDPLGSSLAIAQKVDKRIEAGVCPSCGHYPCTCKSCGKTEEEQQYLDKKLTENRRYIQEKGSSPN